MVVSRGWWQRWGGREWRDAAKKFQRFNYNMNKSGSNRQYGW
jgi:hypothetical protein